jgi:predicted YcjX-like family ATPase
VSSAVSDFIEQTRLAARAFAEFSGHLFNPTVRLGVTGLSRAGKTVFITALVHGLVRGGRFPVFEPLSSGRIAGAKLAPQPDDAVPRFDYERHVRSIVTEREWPDSTRQISELRVVIDYQSPGGAMRTLTLDIVDYPGEWLLDLPLLNKSYEQWSAETLAHLRRSARPPLPKPFLEQMASVNPLAPADENAAIEAARLFTAYLLACRQEHRTLSLVAPGRFLMPGDLAGSPALTFAPVELERDVPIAPRTLAALMERRFDSYKNKVVKPFFSEHFQRIDRQIVLVDVLAAVDAGPAALAELEDALDQVLLTFRTGRASFWSNLFSPRADRVLFAATKADHIHHTSHDRLEALLRLLVQRATRRTEAAGARVGTVALASVRATRETSVRQGWETLQAVAGTPEAGERVGEEIFDGETEAAIFPGELPERPEAVFEGAIPPGSLRFPRFRPPKLPASATARPGRLPHIRLDRALEFLIGDHLL